MPRAVLALFVLVLPPLLQSCGDVTPPDVEGLAARGASLTRPTGPVKERRLSETDLGDLGSGGSIPADINNSNVVVGYSWLANGKQHAFRWTDSTGMTDLGVLPGYDFSYALSVTNDGRIFGVSGLGGSPAWAPVVWDAAGTITRLDIPLLPGASPNAGPGAEDFNGQGVTVGWDWSSTMGEHAWQWSSASGKYDISSEAGEGGAPGDATAVNETGTVAGTTNLMCGEDLRCWRPFVWSGPGSYSEIPLPAGMFGTGLGINNAGTVVGWAQSNGHAQQAYRWRGTLEFLPGTGGAALAVNSHNVAVGLVLDAVDHVSRAVAWTANGNLVYLSPSTHSYHAAIAVNDHEMAVGYVRVSTTAGTVVRAMLWPFTDAKTSGKVLPHLPILAQPAVLRGSVTCVSDGAIISRARLLSCLAKPSGE